MRVVLTYVGVGSKGVQIQTLVYVRDERTTLGEPRERYAATPRKMISITSDFAR